MQSGQKGDMETISKASRSPKKSTSKKVKSQVESEMELAYRAEQEAISKVKQNPYGPMMARESSYYGYPYPP